ncbi:MAG: hypothetical protein RLY16_361 [Bacteroidota bacterium]|jgi:hypothetical protein
MNSFKLDRTAFKAQTVAEAANHSSYYKKKTWQERLAVTFYLNSIAYKFDTNEPPKMNRNLFSTKSLR